ncbi:MAG: group II truncated hemoglobin [Roseiarcus sp.]
MIDDQTTDASLFHRLGGDPAIAAFVARFYDIMAADPQLERIWAWHPKDMAGLKARLGDFLSGFLGGPTLYPQRYGPPMMRRRHLPFPIGRAERDLWMKCARAALAETVGDPAPRAELEAALAAFAEHMRNRDDDGQRAGGCCGDRDDDRQGAEANCGCSCSA